MIQRDELAQYLAEFLRVNEFDDLGPNGLQVYGRSQISKIVTGVSASVELFEQALRRNADAVIVHHGIIWNFERPLYRGGYKKRVKLLLENELNLFAYHLPLDAHEQVGNNAVIARVLGLVNLQPFGQYKGSFIGFHGELPQRLPAQDVFQRIKDQINPDALIFPFGAKEIKKVGIISGGAQKEVQQAVGQELDLFLTGEVSEHIFHYVKEEGIHFVAAGHYATERFGIQALGEHLQKQFAVTVEYVDIPNPV